MKSVVVAFLAVICLAGCAGRSTPGHSASTPSASVSKHAGVSQPLTASVIAGRLQTQIPPMNHLVVFTAATDPNSMLGRQGGYTSKVQWQDSRAIAKGEAPYMQSMKSLGLHPKMADALASVGTGVDLGGSIEVYPSVAGAQARYRYVVGINKAVPMIADGYDYVHGTAVLRLSRYLGPTQVQAYRAAFDAI
jgi:hypothetical protein